MDEMNYKITDFGKYCDLCVHANKTEHEDPCDECLCTCARIGTSKPIKFEKKENRKEHI